MYLSRNGSPYYIGKGSNGRAYKSHGYIPVPEDKSKIIFLKECLSEEEAFKHEAYMIYVIGRKDLGTGPLLNRTSGGQGPAGRYVTEETRKKIGKANKGKPSPNKGNIGVYRASEETKQKMSEAQKGIKNHFYGKTHSDETLRKISGENHYRSRNYILIDPNGVEYTVVGTLRTFCEEHGITYGTMTWAVREKQIGPRNNGWCIIGL